MAASGGTLQVGRVAGAPRWRALALVVALVATLWGFGFATGRFTAPQARVGITQGSPVQSTVHIRPGPHRGLVKFGLTRG